MLPNARRSTEFVSQSTADKSKVKVHRTYFRFLFALEKQQKFVDFLLWRRRTLTVS